MDELRTQRLILRRWTADDEKAMVEINRDPEVARHLNRPVDEAAIAAFHGLVAGHWEQYGFGPYALESREAGLEGRFLGFAGLAHVPPFLSAAGEQPELGWRLARSAWGRGLATEAATAARDDAFERLRLPQLISIIHPENERSQRVATKLGMQPSRQIHNPALDLDVDVWALDAPAG
ncbi:GNAT family N-acetyltransferase [Conexibacter sp. CPCC 206217]|uniref:GNAT family N-acetyltransferase n=1 Tax=Conexibacter sp. CPCC 206217 TaxID=3064574 RepID=UPI0027244828|nr:GNAT family N-acetyltransferase [Conexibacter sp. CPCC 206217]MDO8212839.1 GNAT family N-acetyltransferase [Conexibacter sp. CPCC 206217]